MQNSMIPKNKNRNGSEDRKPSFSGKVNVRTINNAVRTIATLLNITLDQSYEETTAPIDMFATRRMLAINSVVRFMIIPMEFPVCPIFL